MIVRVALLSLMLLCAGAAFATPTAADLRRIEQQLKQERQAGLEARRKAAALSTEMKSVRGQILKSARTVQEREEALSKLENQLDDLNKRQKELEKNISLNDAQLGAVMKGLQTLALRPKEMLFLKPMSPVSTLRSHMLMHASVPVLGTLNEELRRDLIDLLKTRASVSEKAEKIKDAAKELAEKKASLEKLLKQKSSLQARYQATHEQANKRAAALASQASDIKDLLTKLEQEQRRQAQERKRQERLAAEAEARRKAQIAAGQTPSPKTQQPTAGTAKPPARGSFERAKGNLIFPVRGTITRNFNDVTVSGAHMKGMSIEGRINAQVVAPYDGVVLFSGPFKSYGQLLIIDNGDSYITLLAGMERIYASVGQELVSGEPVGTFGTKNTSLYVEIRKDGTALNPRPWFGRN